MAKAPAFQFYSGDFLTGTTLMTNAEVGLFIRLLCLQAEHGSVPDDVERICRVYGEEVRTLWPAVRSKFNHGSTSGVMINERMVTVLAARDAFRVRQVAAGKASAEKRSNLKPTEVQPEVNHGTNHGSTTVEPIEDRDRVITTSKKERAGETPFESWWSIYGKGSRKLSAEQWAKMPEADRLACIDRTPAYIASKPDRIYRKDGERFLRNRTWEDAIVAPMNGQTRPEHTAQRRTLKTTFD